MRVRNTCNSPRSRLIARQKWLTAITPWLTSQHVEYPVAGVEEHEAHGKDDAGVLVDEVDVLDLRHRGLQGRGSSSYCVQDLQNSRVFFLLSACIYRIIMRVDIVFEIVCLC